MVLFISTALFYVDLWVWSPFLFYTNFWVMLHILFYWNFAVFGVILWVGIGLAMESEMLAPLSFTRGRPGCIFRSFRGIEIDAAIFLGKPPLVQEERAYFVDWVLSRASLSSNCPCHLPRDGLRVQVGRSVEGQARASRARAWSCLHLSIMTLSPIHVVTCIRLFLRYVITWTPSIHLTPSRLKCMA